MFRRYSLLCFFISKISPREIIPGLLLLLLLMQPSLTVAQSDTTFKKPEKTHSPRKATIYSAVLPGLGQAYNKKYWKIPIVYAGFGGLAYMITSNTREYKKFKEAYIWKVSGDTIPIDNEYIFKYETADQLKRGKDYYLRNVELSWILTGVWYLLNIIDATVDAHLMDYDINEDLSLELEPLVNPYSINYYHQYAGLTFRLKFK